MKIPQTIIDNYSIKYKPAQGPELTLLWTHAGLAAAERLGLNQNIGDVTQNACLLYATLVACHPEVTFEHACMLLDIEAMHERRTSLMSTVTEARKKADPKFRKELEEILAKVKADEEAATKEQDPNPQTASE